MNIETIRKHKQVGGGFRPFTLRTSEGREFPVPHPEFIAFGKSDLAVVDQSGDINILEALHMVSLKTPKSKNGGTTRR